MTITLYSGFTKRPNSTKQPTSGTDVTVVLKDPEDIYNPSFTLSGGLSTYENVTAVKWGDRYYFVTGITSDHTGVTTISCTLDRMATYKTAIGSAYQFIERCATGYDDNLRDDQILTTDETYTVTQYGSNLFPSSLDNGVVAVWLANTTPNKASGGTAQVVYFDSSPGTYGISQLIRAFYDDSNVITSIEKILNKPYDSILQVRYIPGFTAVGLKTSYPTKFTDSNILYFGDHAFSGSINVIQPTGTGPWTITASSEINLATNAMYQTFKWRNYEPYSTWQMYLPFYGTITIPAAEYIGYTDASVEKCTLVIKATIDITTGELLYQRYRKKYITGLSPLEELVQEYRTTCGVDIAIQSANHDMLSFASDIVTAAGSVALMLASGGSAAGAVAAGAAGAAKGLIDVTSQNYLTAGSFNAHGSQICTAVANTMNVVQFGYYTQTDPTNYASQIGAPLMRQDLISSHSGFIKCRNASIIMGGTQADKDAVNAMMNSGFFYE